MLPPPRRPTRLGLVVFILTLALAFAATPPARAGARDRTLDLYWIDSEGGGSTLVVTPVGESVLIDAGNPGGRDPGRIAKVAREVAGLARIDHLIVTHFHVDHFGGAAELAALLPIKRIWDNGPPEADPDGRRESTWPLTRKPYQAIPTESREVVRAGTALPLRSEAGQPPLELRCHIARQEPWKAFGSKRPAAAASGEPVRKAPDGSDNANSSAWILAFGDFRFYDGGDLSWNIEARLVWPDLLVPEVDVMQVTHHGLDASNHPRLLQALNPTVSVMNNGPTKGAMAEVVTNLRALPGLKAQYQVHRNVQPKDATNGPEELIANLEARCEGHFIHCAVAPDGRSYTFSIPSRDHRARFDVRPKP